jgi:acyl-CoA thioester hydrolase
MPNSERPLAPPTSPAFFYPVRVYYEDTDTGGVVYYANYLKFFERARTEWLRALGVSQQTLAIEKNIMFVVSTTQVQYLRPARLDDLLSIESRIEKMGHVSLEFLQIAQKVDETPSNSGQKSPLNDNFSEPLAIGRIKVGCVDRNSLRPTALPETLRSAFLPL